MFENLVHVLVHWFWLKILVLQAKTLIMYSWNFHWLFFLLFIPSKTQRGNAMPAIHRNKKPLITNTGIWDKAGEVPSHSSSDCLRSEFDKFLQFGSCNVTGVISLAFWLKGLYFDFFKGHPPVTYCLYIWKFCITKLLIVYLLMLYRH